MRTSANEYTGIRQEKTQNDSGLQPYCLGKIFAGFFFLSIFQTPEENSEDTNTPISLSNIGLKVIKSGVYCN